MQKIVNVFLLAAVLFLSACADHRIDVILDSDANNELDDQHAIAYLLMHQDEARILAITTNATRNGGDAHEQACEAQRVADLMGSLGEDIEVIPGATANYEDILDQYGLVYDGQNAVECIVRAARRHTPDNPLLLIPVGKLTNIAMALGEAPDIIPNVRVVWLGSNYPQAGEYNLENDIPSVNAVIDSGVDFTMAIVASSEGMKGTCEVTMNHREMVERVADKGTRVAPVEGRSGGAFTCVGDYLLNLFEQCSSDDNYTRSLFDMACVAAALHPEYAEVREIPAPLLEGLEWRERPGNMHTIKVQCNFNREAILNDFISHLDELTE